MDEFYERTLSVIQSDNLEILKRAHVAVFGLGGVGSFCAESLVRSGFGKLSLCDGDTVSVSNINRQLIALRNTVGKKKTSVCSERYREINPDCNLIEYPFFITPETDFSFLKDCDYVADCIDDVPAKIALISFCKQNRIPIISSMGCGNRLDPQKLTVTDIYKTSGCPLARSVRSKLRALNIDSLDVVFSTEVPVRTGNSVPGSLMFVPGTAGLILSSVITRNLISR